MQEKTRAAAISVISNTVLTVGKVLTGLLSGSVSVLSEGIHSGIDLLAAVIALFAVKESTKPADARHAYGHGKIENVSGTIEALLIFIAALWIMVEAIEKLVTGGRLENVSFGIVIMGISALTNLFVSNKLMRVAKKTDSVALEADALHLRTDVYTSAGVFVGLILMELTGWQIFDPLIAIIVALLIVKAAYDLTKEAFMPLVDVSIPEEEYQVIVSVLESYAGSFVEFHKLRTRRSGPERHIDLHLVVPKTKSLVEVHQLCDKIEQEIQARIPGTHVLIHAEPCTEREEHCPACDSNHVCQKSLENKKSIEIRDYGQESK